MNIQLFLLIWIVPIIVNIFISILSNWKDAKTVGELFTLMDGCCWFMVFIPILGAGLAAFWLLVFTIHICTNIPNIITGMSWYKWFIEHVWNHKLR